MFTSLRILPTCASALKLKGTRSLSLCPSHTRVYIPTYPNPPPLAAVAGVRSRSGRGPRRPHAWLPPGRPAPEAGTRARRGLLRPTGDEGRLKGSDFCSALWAAGIKAPMLSTDWLKGKSVRLFE
eukprot:2463490-Pleurochrysis_carterae.AAC.1